MSMICRPDPAKRPRPTVHVKRFVICLALMLSSCTTPAGLESLPVDQRSTQDAILGGPSVNEKQQSEQASNRHEMAAGQPSVRPSTRSQPVKVHSDLADIQFTIQVGAFTDAGKAAAYAVSLLNSGLDAYYFIDADGFSKVRIERFSSETAARKRAVALHASGLIDDFFIVHPSMAFAAADPLESLRENIARTAGRFIGTPYRWGGESIRKGFDCSGLTMTVYRLNGLELPRNSRSQFRAGKPVPGSALKTGDLVFFSTNGRRRVSHVGIYCGEGKFIHAPGRGKRIRISSLANGYFKRRFIGGRRYF